MPPTGGEGGNIALRDAGLLLDCLLKVVSSEDCGSVMKSELPRYEKEMLEFSRRCVSRSHRSAKIRTVEGYVMPYVIRFAMRIANFFFGVSV